MLKIVDALPVNMVVKVLKRELRDGVQSLELEHAREEDSQYKSIWVVGVE